MQGETTPSDIAVCCAPQGISDVLVGEDVALEGGGHVLQVIERDGHIFGVAVAVEHGEEGSRVLDVHRWNALIFAGHELHEPGVGLQVLGAPLRVRPGKRELVDQRYDAHCRISELGCLQGFSFKDEKVSGIPGNQDTQESHFAWID